MESSTKNKNELDFLFEQQDAYTSQQLDDSNTQLKDSEHKPKADKTSTQKQKQQKKSKTTPVKRSYLSRAKAKQTDVILFTNQLSVMLESGVILSEALDVVANQTPHGVFKTIITDVADVVRTGDSLSRALSNYPRVFNVMFISMVKASEASGKMAEMLNVLSGYLDFEHETRKRIKGALVYPFIMALMAVVAVSTLIIFVVPRLVKVYETRGAELPKLTQMLIDFSRMFTDPQLVSVTMTVLLSVLMLLYYWINSKPGKRVIDYIKIRLPVFGTMVVDRTITRSMRIMATMVNTGVGILDAIGVIKNSSANCYFQQLWTRTDKRIRDGYQLSESIQIAQSGMRSLFNRKDRMLADKLIDSGVIQMIKAGEKGGRLGEVCFKISYFYEKRFEASIRVVTSLIEPLMIIVLGGIIGTISIALLLPVFRISSVIAG